MKTTAWTGVAMRSTSRHFFALARLSKRIHHQAKPLLFRMNTFTFSEPRTALDFAARQQYSDPIGYQRTTHLGIRMRPRHRQDFCRNTIWLWKLDWTSFFSDAKTHYLDVHTLIIDVTDLTYMLERTYSTRLCWPYLVVAMQALINSIRKSEDWSSVRQIFVCGVSGADYKNKIVVELDPKAEALDRFAEDLVCVLHTPIRRVMSV